MSFFYTIFYLFFFCDSELKNLLVNNRLIHNIAKYILLIEI